jgi:hypothetical protein
MKCKPADQNFVLCCSRIMIFMMIQTSFPSSLLDTSPRSLKDIVSHRIDINMRKSRRHRILMFELYSISHILLTQSTTEMR